MSTKEAPADASNWRTAPHSEWAFQNVDKVVPTQTIKKSTSPSTLAKADTSIDSLVVPVSEGKTLDLKSLLKGTDTDAFIVLHRGKVVYEYYDRGNSPSSKHIIMSITKSITGLLVGIIAEQGLLHVDDPVVKHVPELKGTPYEATTIRHLIDMRSGVVYDDNTHDYRLATRWEVPYEGEKQSTLRSFIADFRPETEAPSGPFRYISINTDVIGIVLERVSGKKYAELVHELLWQPMGAESDALITVDDNKDPRAAGGLCASVRDLARLGRALIEGKLVSAEWLKDIISGGDQDVLAKSAWGPAFKGFSPTLAYRAFWLADADADLLMGMGTHGQNLIVDIKNDIVVAKTSSQPGRFDVAKFAPVIRAFRMIQKELTS